jgi:uncharacterized membrane protein YebE (DUF533 family)
MKRVAIMFNAKALLDALVSAGSQAAAKAGDAGQGGVGGMLGNLATQAQQGLQSGGGIGGMIGSVLSQATQGLQQAGQDVNARTGLGDKASEMLGQATGGRSANDLIEQAKGMIGGNQLAAGAAMGALGGLLFGTSSGRSIATSAAKLGGMALIGGLAYKAYQDYSAGKPLLSGAAAQAPALPAPSGSGFEAEAATDETATLYIRAMIAAAAADGDIDENERQVILGGLKAVGFDPAANTWLDDQMANPASVDDLVAEATTPELAAQTYTAARLAINPDTAQEKDFLAGLSASLGLDAELVAHIDAAATAAKV